MPRVATVLLDNQAFTVMQDAAHSEHRRILAMMTGIAKRKSRGVATSIGIPTTVRIEANWDRQLSGAAAINRLPIPDIALAASMINPAASLHSALPSLSVPDSHLGIAMSTSTTPVAVVTSDDKDVKAMSDHLKSSVTIVHV